MLCHAVSISHQLLRLARAWERDGHVDKCHEQGADCHCHAAQCAVCRHHRPGSGHAAQQPPYHRQGHLKVPQKRLQGIYSVNHPYTSTYQNIHLVGAESTARLQISPHFPPPVGDSHARPHDPATRPDEECGTQHVSAMGREKHRLGGWHRSTDTPPPEQVGARGRAPFERVTAFLPQSCYRLRLG